MRPVSAPAWGTRLLLLVNVVVFALQLWGADDRGSFVERWGLVPLDISGPVRGLEGATPAVLVTLVTSLFLHAGWLHLISNLLYLGVFGSAVEAAVGTKRFLLIYFVGGIAGALAHVWAQPDSLQPTIGASGAVAAIIAANLALFPGATLGSLAPVLFFSTAANTPVVLLLVLWVVAQFFSSVAAVTSAGVVAWWAHAGGFVAGLVLGSLLGRRRRRRW